MDYNNFILSFLNCCELQKGLDAKTIKAYSIDLKQFSLFSSASPSESEKDLICSYIENMHNIFKPKTIKRKIATLKSFFHYLELEELIEINPFSKIHFKLKEPTILPKTIPALLLTKILNEAYREKAQSNSNYSFKCAVRDIAILELLFETGHRVSELCYLKAEDVNLTENYIKTFGKGAKERILQLCSADVISALRAYKKNF